MASVQLQPIPNLTGLRDAPAGTVTTDLNPQNPKGENKQYFFYGLALLFGIAMSVTIYYNQRDKLKDNKKKLYMIVIFSGLFVFALLALLIYTMNKK